MWKLGEFQFHGVHLGSHQSTEITSFYPITPKGISLEKMITLQFWEKKHNSNVNNDNNGLRCA